MTQLDLEDYIEEKGGRRGTTLEDQLEDLDSSISEDGSIVDVEDLLSYLSNRRLKIVLDK